MGLFHNQGAGKFTVTLYTCRSISCLKMRACPRMTMTSYLQGDNAATTHSYHSGFFKILSLYSVSDKHIFNKVDYLTLWLRALISMAWYNQLGFSRTLIEVRKSAKIRNRHNQVPHLTQDTNGKVTNPQLEITNESQEVNPFPTDARKASIKRRAQKHNKHKTETTYMIHKRRPP